MDVALFDFETITLHADYGELLVGAIKPYGKTPIVVFQREPNSTDRNLAVAIRDELEKYDIIVSFNGKMFDIPFLNTRLMYHDERRKAPQFHLDLYWIARNLFRMTSNSQASLAKFFGFEEQKLDIPQPVWARAQAGDPKSMSLLVKRCTSDIKTLEEMFKKVKRHIMQIRRDG